MQFLKLLIFDKDVNKNKYLITNSKVKIFEASVLFDKYCLFKLWPTNNVSKFNI